MLVHCFKFKLSIATEYTVFANILWVICEHFLCHFVSDLWTIFDPSTRKSNFFYFNGLLLAKHILFELKKYRGVIFHDTEEWCKI